MAWWCFRMQYAIWCSFLKIYQSCRSKRPDTSLCSAKADSLERLFFTSLPRSLIRCCIILPAPLCRLFRWSKEFYIPLVCEVAAFCPSLFSAFGLLWSGAWRWCRFCVFWGLSWFDHLKMVPRLLLISSGSLCESLIFLALPLAFKSAIYFPGRISVEDECSHYLSQILMTDCFCGGWWCDNACRYILVGFSYRLWPSDLPSFLCTNTSRKGSFPFYFFIFSLWMLWVRPFYV